MAVKQECLYIGIDPGWSGAIAIKRNDNSITVYKCPASTEEISNLFKKIILPFDSKNIFAVIEEVHGRGYKNGRGEKWSANNTFRFGENFGTWKSLLSSHSIKFTTVRPQEWQHWLLGKIAKGTSKQASIERVYKHHSDLEIGKNHNLADAINLADLCKDFNFKS